jgi:hypothetical protein
MLTIIDSIKGHLAEVTQISPGWIKFLGSGGVVGVVALIGGLFVSLVKKHVDALEAQKKALEGEKSVLDERISFLSLQLSESDKKREDGEKNILECFEIIRHINTKEGVLSDEEELRLKRIQLNFQRFQSIQPEIQDCKIVMEWLSSNKNAWIEEAVDLAQKNNRKHFLMRAQNKIRFYSDISQYIDWLQSSLFFAHSDAPLEKFVEKTAINSRSLYLGTLHKIKELAIKESACLSVAQTRYLNYYFEKLIEKVDFYFT